MPSNPQAGDVHVNAPLTNISIAYAQGAGAFVATEIFPVIPVAKQGDKYFIYSREDWLRAEAQKRAPSTESAGAGWNVTTDSYFAELYALHQDVDDHQRTNADAPLDMDRDATEFITEQTLLKRELDFMSTHFTTSVWTGSTSGGDITPTTKWDAAAGLPIAEIKAQMRSVQSKTGRKPNRLVLTPAVWDAITENADVRDRIKYVQRDVMTTDIFAALLGIERVIVAEGIVNSAAEGATESTDFIINSDQALLLYANPRPSLRTPSAGYTFVWNALFGAGGGAGMRIKRFRMDHLNSDRIEGEATWDHKVVAAELGAFFTDVLA
jgi:hypothetical protein